MNIFPTAHAASAPASATDGGFSMIIMIVGFAAIFYFLVWRPQNQRLKEHRELLAQLKKGDEVITNGGLLGKVTKISDDFVEINISENVDITIQKSAITATLPKGTLKSI